MYGKYPHLKCGLWVQWSSLKQTKRTGVNWQLAVDKNIFTIFYVVYFLFIIMMIIIILQEINRYTYMWKNLQCSH